MTSDPYQIRAQDWGDQYTLVHEYMFYKDELLTSIEIPQGFTEIKTAAFSNCPALRSVTIPNSITSIMASVFSNDTALESITLPDSATNLQ